MKVRMAGAKKSDHGETKFSVWAPHAKKVQLLLKDREDSYAMEKRSGGYWEYVLKDQPGKISYKYLLDGKAFPDPASRNQGKGVHSWSQVSGQDGFKWQDQAWRGRTIAEMLIYELHVGTFTEKGTFQGVSEKLDHLIELGINTIEIMPVAQFPGERNWGYDGVYPYAVQESYGGAAGFKELIDTCHQKGIAVILDVVYNHQGPEGNYLSEFGPYFTDKYKTPWGSALNFDDEYSDPVRNFFIENALMWLRDFHLDGLRLDAVHEIIDRGANHLLKELSQRVDRLEKETLRNYTIIAESDLNDKRIIECYGKGGYGLEGQWADDFHHSLHTLLTGENNGYYRDFGKMVDFEKAFKQAFVYDGVYSEFRKRTVGKKPGNLAAEKFVVCIQNHDQVGNRMLGERLSNIISFEKLKLAAGLLLISPFTPLLFMGEEFAEDHPFQYFVSHGDKALVKAVQEGRKREFRYFHENDGEFPDPQSEETFSRSKLNWDFRKDKSKNQIFEYYKNLLHMRKQGVFMDLRIRPFETESDQSNQLFQVYSRGQDNSIFIIANFGSESRKVVLPQEDQHEIILSSSEKKWGGSQGALKVSKAGDFKSMPASLNVFRFHRQKI